MSESDYRYEVSASIDGLSAEGVVIFTVVDETAGVTDEQWAQAASLLDKPAGQAAPSDTPG